MVWLKAEKILVLIYYHFFHRKMLTLRKTENWEWFYFLYIDKYLVILQVTQLLQSSSNPCASLWKLSCYFLLVSCSLQTPLCTRITREEAHWKKQDKKPYHVVPLWDPEPCFYSKWGPSYAVHMFTTLWSLKINRNILKVLNWSHSIWTVWNLSLLICI